MKFSVFFTSPGLRRISVYIGILIGITISFFTDWRLSVLIGALVTLAVSVILPVIFYCVFLPYARMKKSLPQPFLLDEPVQFTVKSGRVGGFFVLTKRSMVLLSRECETQTMELTHDKVVKTVAKRESPTLDIYLNDTQFISVFSVKRDELVETLRANGWNVVE